MADKSDTRLLISGDEEWRSGRQASYDGLVRAGRSGGLISGHILSQSPQLSVDTAWPLAHAVYQHYPYSEIKRIYRYILADLINGITSLQKYFVLHQHALVSGYMAEETITTELEFVLVNYRSFYDLLNKLLDKIRKRLTAERNGAKFKLQELNKSFDKMVEKSDDDLRVKFLLPDNAVDFYRKHERPFKVLREIRNNVLHHGHSVDLVFVLDDGFAVSRDNKMFEKLQPFNIWPSELSRENNLVSLLPLLVFIVQDMLEAASELAGILCTLIGNPAEPFAGNEIVYYRSDVMLHLPRLELYRTQQWFNPQSMLANIRKDASQFHMAVKRRRQETREKRKGV